MWSPIFSAAEPIPTTKSCTKASASTRSNRCWILPEVLDESKWYEGRHRYTDPEQRHVFIYIANPSSSGFYYNTNLVNPKEINPIGIWSIPNGRANTFPRIR